MKGAFSGHSDLYSAKKFLQTLSCKPQKFIVNHGEPGKIKFFGEDNPYRNWYPANAFEDLCPFPIAEMLPNNAPIDLFLNPQTAIYLSLGYVTLFLGISYLVFIRRDM